MPTPNQLVPIQTKLLSALLAILIAILLLTIKAPQTPQNLQPKATGATPTIPPLQSPTPSPSPTPTPDVTPSPTPTPSPGNITLDLEIKLKGVNDTTTTDKKIKFSLSGPSTFTTDLSIITQADGGHKLHIVLPAGINPGSGYTIALKGAHHLSRKLTQITLPQGGSTKTLDFTELPLIPGDLNSDGKADGADLDIIKPRLSSTQTADTSVADVNYDGVVSGTDLILVRRSVELGLTDEK